MSQKISEMTKLPTLTGATKIPTGEPGPGGNYATDPDQISGLIGGGVDPQDLAIVAGAPDTLTVNCNSKREVIIVYEGSADHDFTLTNAGSLNVLHVHAKLSNTIVIQFDANVVSVEGLPIGASWDDTNQQLTITAVTDELWEYSITRVNHGAGNVYKLIIQGPFI